MSKRWMLKSSRRRIRRPWLWLPFGLRMRCARIRALLVRHRLIRKAALAIALGGAVGWWAVAVAEANESAARWGETRSVVVAFDDRGIGDPIAGALRKVLRPIALIPDDALSEPPDPDDRIVREWRVGDIVTERHFSSTRSRSFHVPEGARAIGVPASIGLPPLNAGDEVDVFLIADPLDPTPPDADSLALRADVLLVDDEVVTLAVPAARVRVLAQTLLSGRVVVALR